MQTLVSDFFALDQNIDWTEFLTRLIEISHIYKELSEEIIAKGTGLGIKKIQELKKNLN